MTTMPIGRALLVGTLAAATTWTAMLSWRGLVQDASGFLGPLLYVAGLVVLVGVLLRLVHVPAAVTGVVQVAAVSVFLLWEVVGSAVPDSSGVSTFTGALRGAVETAQQFQAPVPVEAPSLDPLFLTAGALAVVAVDVLAAGLRRVGLAGLVWLGVFAVPVGIVDSSSAWLFTVAAVGFLSLLFLQQGDQVARWGRTVDPARPGVPDDPDPGFDVRTGAVRSTAAKLGLGAVCLALLLPPVVPTVSLALFDGVGAGGGRVTLANPLVDMRRDLSRGEDVPLLQVTTDGRAPSYVRLSVLTRYSGEEWSSGDRDIPSSQTAAGAVPDPVGLAPDLPRRSTDYVFAAADTLQSRWLPTPSLVSRVAAEGDWRYDTATMDFIARDDGLDTAGLVWEATGLDVEYDAKRLDEAGPRTGTAALGMTDLPSDLPPMVGELAESVTAGQPTRFRQARALQEWFRTEFDYSLEQVESVGNSELVAFLSESGREGYCEQFAAAMAVMARELDIPARVAVGFLQPDGVGRDSWEFSSHDLHAWPELYFQGSGWVRFEPTPPGRALGVPQYTEAQLPSIDDEPTARPPVPQDRPGPQDRPAEEPGTEDQDLATSDDAEGFAWGRLLAVVATALVVAAAALSPRWVRRRRRERHLAEARIEGVWSELRDVALDLGLAWPGGRSPRATAEWLVDWFGAPGSVDAQDRPRRGPHEAPDAVRALSRLVEAVERDRYSRTVVTERWEERVRDWEQCVEALKAGASGRSRLAARWWPASVLRRARRRAPDSTAPAGEMLSGPGERGREPVGHGR